MEAVVSVGNIIYGFRWGLHLLNRLRYAHYRFMVFLSKDGAAHLTAFLSFGFVFATHYLTSGLPDISETETIGEAAIILFDWLQYPHEDKGWLIVIEVPLLALGLFAAIMPQSIIRMGLGMFPAMKRPMRPLKKLQMQDEALKSVKAQLVIKPLSRPADTVKAREDAYNKLPEVVRNLLST